MTGRSAKMMIAYVPSLTEKTEAKVTYKTAGGYDHAGLVFNHSASAWEVQAVGYSVKSIAKRTRTAVRNMYPRSPGFWDAATAVVPLHEVTAPILREYFGDHRLAVCGIFRPETGWETVDWKAGRSNIRWMAEQGVTAISVCRANRLGTQADFQMTEIVKSVNARKALVP
jgi:hypothetical protein